MKTAITTLLSASVMVLSACGSPLEQGSSELSDSFNSPCSGFTVPSDGHSYYCASYMMYDITGSPTGNRETLFRISSAFSEAQKAKIRSGLDVAMRAVGSHFNEKYVNKRSQSPFQECVKKHTRSYIEPINAAIKGQDAAFYADIAMSGVTLLQNFHEFRDIPVDISPINFPVTDTVVVAQAYLGQDSTHVGATQNMNFKINVHALDLAFIDAQSLGGTVVHEWLHRLGFDHPQDDTGTLVEIAGQCVHYDYDVGPSAGLLGGLDIIR